MIELLIVGAVVLFLLFAVAVVVGTVIKWGNDYPGLEDVTLEDL